MKTVKEAAVGETLFCSSVESKDVKPFSEFKPTKPSVYAGFFPFTATSYEELKKAVERLALNDPSVEIAADSSTILGLGWRIGFLGLLHMVILCFIDFHTYSILGCLQSTTRAGI